MTTSREAFEAGQAAFADKEPSSSNPFTPCDPDSPQGNLARMWNRGYYATVPHPEPLAD